MPAPSEAQHQGRPDLTERAVRLLKGHLRRALTSLRRRRAARRRRREVARRTYRAWVSRYDAIDERELERIRAFGENVASRPLISILMPLREPPEQLLREAIESVLAQAYQRWELCVAGVSTTAEAAAVVAEYAADDARIGMRADALPDGLHSAALALASGDLVAFMDDTDVLRPHALLLVAHTFSEHPELSCIYSDEDRLDAAGERVDHWFKPDWNPALLAAQDYLGRLTVYRSALVERCGGSRVSSTVPREWDLALRATSAVAPDEIGHIPHVLCHRRGSPTPVAVETKPRASRVHGGSQPSVSVVVPSTGVPERLSRCVQGLRESTRYPELEILPAVSESACTDPSTRSFLEELGAEARVRLLAYAAGTFNFAWVTNWAAAQARGDLLLFLNDDTAVVHGDWLEIMVDRALRERVGAVGAVLVYPDDTIQHAGVLLGAKEAADHLYRGRARGTAGYHGRALADQDLSAVTAACMLVRREAFVEVGGFDESFAVAYNDVDFCLRLRQAGWRVVLAAAAVLRHEEAASFGAHWRGREVEHRREEELLRERWGVLLRRDPMHNPNLDLDASYPDRLAFPPRVSYPWSRHEADFGERRHARPDAC